MGLTPVLRALARRLTLAKLVLHCCPSVQSLNLVVNNLGSAGLAELVPAFDHNTSIKELDMSQNNLNDMESAEMLQDILRSNTTMTTIDLSGNQFGQTTGAVECIADALGSNSTLLEIDLSNCGLGDAGISILAQTLGSRNTTLQKLTLNNNYITAMGESVLLETMEQSSHHITDLYLQDTRFGNEGASLLARSLGNNALPNLTSLSLDICDVDDDGFIAMLSALEQNTSLLHLNLRCNHFSVGGAIWSWRRAFQRSKCCNELTFAGAQGLARPCLCCWQD